MTLKRLTAILLGGFLVTSCTKKPLSEASKEDEVSEVVAVQLKKEELFDFMSFSGTLAAHSQETIYAALSGKIQGLSVQEGLKVSKGQKLMLIKPDSEGYEYRDHVVKASRNGTVLGGMLAKDGIHVDKNQELLNIADLSSFKTELSATVGDLEFLKTGQDVDIILDPSNKDRKVRGKVGIIPRTPDVKTKTFTVPVTISCKDAHACQSVYPGLLGQVLVKKNPHMGYKLPFKYLRRQGSHVLVLNKDNTVSFKEVVVGQHYGQDVEILSGVTEETRIVTSYSSFPQEGEKVKVLAPDASSSEKDDGSVHEDDEDSEA